MRGEREVRQRPRFFLGSSLFWSRWNRSPKVDERPLPRGREREAAEEETNRENDAHRCHSLRKLGLAAKKGKGIVHCLRRKDESRTFFGCATHDVASSSDLHLFHRRPPHLMFALKLEESAIEAGKKTMQSMDKIEGRRKEDAHISVSEISLHECRLRGLIFAREAERHIFTNGDVNGRSHGTRLTKSDFQRLLPLRNDSSSPHRPPGLTFAHRNL